MASSRLAPLTMVSSVEIRNFRGFGYLAINDLPLVNVIVGDNGVGKTAILEAIYLAVSGNAQQPLNLKKWRGQDISFQSSGDSVAEAIYSDLFHDAQSDEPVVIDLKGRGFENRHVEISRSRGEIILPTKELSNRQERRKKKALGGTALQTADPAQKKIVPILLKWTDQFGNTYNTRALISPIGVEFEGTNERLPNCFLYASQTAVPASEAALHFSALRKTRQIEKFRQIFLSVFDQIKDIDIAETGAGSVLVADVPWAKELLPLPLLSGGTNRAATILLAITQRENGLVMVDEVENGIFHARHATFSNALLQLARTYQTQLVLTTHSEEWIEHFLEVAESTDDIAFWRAERDKEHKVTIRRFGFSDFRSAFAAGEMR